MKCPFCEAGESKVTDSRDADHGIRRRRECLSCGRRFTTYELARLPTLEVEKRDGSRQDFSRDKLLAGIHKACARRPIPQRDIARLVDDIELELQRRGSFAVAAADLGLMALERLRPLDEVAYLRYASVYHDFQSAADFAAQIRSLQAGRPEPLVAIAASSPRRTRQRRATRRSGPNP